MGTGYPTGYGVNPSYVSGICQHRSQLGQSFTLPVACFGDTAIDTVADWYETI